MLVMSLSPLLGQAIPDIAKTAEILVFPRWGARSGSSRVPKPQEENKSPYPPRNSWRVLGGARGGLGARFWHTLGFSAIQVAIFANSSVSSRLNFDKFLKFSVLAGSAKQFPASFFHGFLTI